MANPTDVSGFSFTVFYDYQGATYQYAAGSGAAGQTEAQRFYNEAQTNAQQGVALTNIVVRYISTPTWTDWEQA